MRPWRQSDQHQRNALATVATATSLGAISTSPSGASFGLDFNPTVDRLRMVSDTNQNLRINQIATPPRVGGLGTQGITGITIVAVPEPGTWAITLLGLGGMGVALRRRRPATRLQTG